MPRNFASLILLCATLLVAPLTAVAAPITVPTGLNPGDQYRLAFVTSTTRAVDSVEAAVYTAFVTNVALSVPELAALATNWRGIGSVPSVDARDHTETNPSSTGVPIYRLDDRRIANDNADLWDGALLEPLSTIEDGTIPSSALLVWTSTNTSGTLIPISGLDIVYGNSFLSDVGWIDSGIDNFSIQHHFYVISDVLTVPVPEPSGFVLAAFGIIGLAALGWRRRQGRYRLFLVPRFQFRFADNQNFWRVR